MLTRAPTQIDCPFNSPIYVSGLAHLGSMEFPPAAPAPILRRPVPGTSRFDGLGSWPYLWIDTEDEISALSEAYRHLLTLTVVTQPGFRPACEAAAYFKDHYLYDPSRALPALSKKAREHLRRAEQICAFDVVTQFDERVAITGLYEELRRRRGLAGTFFDFPRIHFETVARLDGAVFFRVRNGDDVCAMACGFAFGDWIQLLHIAITDAGLRQDASYCLMNSMLKFARSERRLLCMGAYRALAMRGCCASRHAGRTGRSQCSCSGLSTIARPMPSSFGDEKTSAISPPIVPPENCAARRLSAPRPVKQQ